MTEDDATFCCLVLLENSEERHWKKYLSGWIAATTNVIVTYPFMKISGRQLLNNLNVKESMKKLYEEGIFMFYRGVMPPLIMKSLNISFMFGSYSQAFAYFSRHSMNPLQANIGGGIISASFQTVVMPFERIQILLFTEKYNTVYKNTFHAFKDLLRKEGVKELYRGFTISAVKNSSAHTTFFICKYYGDRRIKQIEIPVLWGLANFFQGSILSIISALSFHPLLAMRIHVQQNVGGEYKSIKKIAVEIYKKGKLKAFYRGVGMQCIKGFFTGGVINTCYELCLEFLKRFN